MSRLAAAPAAPPPLPPHGALPISQGVDLRLAQAGLMEDGKAVLANARGGLQAAHRARRGHGDEGKRGQAGLVQRLEDALVASLRSEEHTSELQSREKLVCRRLLGQ